MISEELARNLRRESQARLAQTQPLLLDDVLAAAQRASIPSSRRRRPIVVVGVAAATVVAVTAIGAVVVTQSDDATTSIATDSDGTTIDQSGAPALPFSAEARVDAEKRTLEIIYIGTKGWEPEPDGPDWFIDGGKVMLPTYLYIRSADGSSNTPWNVNTVTGRIEVSEEVNLLAGPFVAPGEVFAVTVDLAELPVGDYTLTDNAAIDLRFRLAMR